MPLKWLAPLYLLLAVYAVVNGVHQRDWEWDGIAVLLGISTVLNWRSRA